MKTRGPFFTLLMCVAIMSGCRSSVTGNNFGYEYTESFAINAPVGQITSISLTNVNGNITVTGKAGVSRIEIAGLKRVSDQSYDEAKAHIGDIEVDTATSGSRFTITTTQPNTSGQRGYNVDYEVTIPLELNATVVNINGTIQITGMSGDVAVTLTNGLFSANSLAGNLTAFLTNGNIGVGMTLPDSGTCNLKTLNGSISLAVPSSTSASVTASVINGAVSVSDLPLVVGSSSTTSLKGTLGSGTGTISVSTLNGTIQLTKL